MGEAVRRMTPVEMLQGDLESIIMNDAPLKENITRERVKEAVQKALSYEKTYYDDEYKVISCRVKDSNRKAEILRKQNEILTEHIIMKEKGIVE